MEFRKNFSEKKIFDSLAKGGSYFACSASLFDSSCKFIGLYTNGSNTINGINFNSGSGNFYLQPNGFLGLTNADVDLLATAKFDQSKNYAYALQSGPMLIIDKDINTLFDKQSVNKNIRIGVGSYSKKNSYYMVFAVSLVPVTFYEISSLLLDNFNCNNALNLSGGQLSSFHMPTANTPGDSGKFPCNLIYIPIE